MAFINKELAKTLVTEEQLIRAREKFEWFMISNCGASSIKKIKHLDRPSAPHYAEFSTGIGWDCWLKQEKRLLNKV